MSCISINPKINKFGPTQRNGTVGQRMLIEGMYEVLFQSYKLKLGNQFY
jgi:hypothetical protein